MRSPVVELRRALRSLGRSVAVPTRFPLGRAPYVHARGQINPFDLDRPASIRDAVRGLTNHLDARAMAGGIDLLNEMKQGAEVRRVVHLGGIARLRGIRLTREFLTIGAATTHAQIETDLNAAQVLPALPAIVREIANVRVRAVGTIGGNVMSGYRTYDWLPVLLALGAEASFEDREARWLPIDVLTTADGRWRIPQRLLREVRIPLWGEPVLRFNRDLKPAISVAVCLRSRAAQRVARIAVGCVHTAPVVRDVEGFDELETLTPSVLARSAAHAIAAPPRADAIAEALGARVAARFPVPHDDGLASAAYRQAMVKTLAIRGLQEALSQA